VPQIEPCCPVLRLQTLLRNLRSRRPPPESHTPLAGCSKSPLWHAVRKLQSELSVQICCPCGTSEAMRRAGACRGSQSAPGYSSHRDGLCETRPFIFSFPDVCPEPALVNERFTTEETENGAQKAVSHERSGSEPRLKARAKNPRGADRSTGADCLQKPGCPWRYRCSRSRCLPLLR
jgi:hypothetical protein